MIWMKEPSPFQRFMDSMPGIAFSVEIREYLAKAFEAGRESVLREQEEMK